MRDACISLDEWKAKTGLVATAGRCLPDCTSLFVRLRTVPGQTLHQSPLWVALIELIGGVLGVPEMTHPAWEQTATVGPASRYYPTMDLFSTHNHTALARLERIEHIACSEALRLVMSAFGRPMRKTNDPDSELAMLCPEVIDLQYGPLAAALCQHVEGLAFQHNNVRRTIEMSRLSFALTTERSHLVALKQAQVEYNAASSDAARKEEELLPLRAEHDAARASVVDVDLSAVASFLPADSDLSLMFDCEI
eukprot:gene18007-27730_t